MLLTRLIRTWLQGRLDVGIFWTKVIEALLSLHLRIHSLEITVCPWDSNCDSEFVSLPAFTASNAKTEILYEPFNINDSFAPRLIELILHVHNGKVDACKRAFLRI